MIKYVIENVIAYVLIQEHVHAIVEQVEECELLKSVCRRVIKAIVKFTLVGLYMYVMMETFNDLCET